ncbi:hypothetical protein JZX76_09425 [Haloarcula hispanica]|uniref:Uncharacterized protein n=1 Tax=Haloarcula hispanica TaxID=51589 RepID=A0A482TG95_HALHI|nr:hypothetical protein [Haloarcula hispanica]MCJ0619722.1 hypothetical protein [Haloarcula hispanica]RYJ10183.1 hypothetical protein ELS20_09345 [Haloarcula hispanica]
MTEDDPQWKETLGLADDSTRVQVICKEQHRDEWTTDADEKGYSSRSSYLYELIEEARAYRKEGYLGWEHAQERIEELETEVEQLESELDKEKEANKSPLSNSAAVKRHLSENYRPLSDIVEEFLQEEDLEQVLRPAIEGTLHTLAGQDEVKYQRGHGWQLTEGGER